MTPLVEHNRDKTIWTNVTIIWMKRSVHIKSFKKKQGYGVVKKYSHFYFKNFNIIII